MTKCATILIFFNLFSGDQDSILPLTRTQVVVNGLAKQLGLNTTLPYRAWFNGNQVSLLLWSSCISRIICYVFARCDRFDASYVLFLSGHKNKTNMIRYKGNMLNESSGL
ncbi:putative peptidase S10, serine carboxypeptidase [Helianthus annuus]|nr:putative peptidase S10, serine carboxypeptidase [Helianthus annuus]